MLDTKHQYYRHCITAFLFLVANLAQPLLAMPLSYVYPKTITNDGLTSEFLQSLQKFYASPTLIETGTYQGATTLVAAQHFAQVITIELDRKLYQACVRKFQAVPHITILPGASEQLLAQAIRTAKQTHRLIFWLDAHDATSPITQELQIIAAAKELTAPIILIDDLRHFQPNTLGYPDIQQLQQLSKSLFPDHTFLVYGDVAILSPNSAALEVTAGIKFMTASLLNFDDDVVARPAELALIEQTAASERAEIIRLHDQFNGPGQIALIQHLKLWAALAYIGEQKYNHAIRLLQELQWRYPRRKLARVTDYLRICYKRLSQVNSLKH